MKETLIFLASYFENANANDILLFQFIYKIIKSKKNGFSECLAPLVRTPEKCHTVFFGKRLRRKHYF